MTDTSFEDIRTGAITISQLEYQKLLADSLYAEMASDIIESMPVDMKDMLEEDDERWTRWLTMNKSLRE